MDFSRWLDENIEALDERVVFDIDPKSVRQEVSAWNGTLRVDLLCEAILPGSDEPLPVVIENQLYAADGSEKRIGADAITDKFKANVTTFMCRIVSRKPARHVPSARVCSWCEISSEDCSERIEPEVA